MAELLLRGMGLRLRLTRWEVLLLSQSGRRALAQVHFAGLPCRTLESFAWR